jgi:microcompartment protein CcmK/EutM
MLLAQVVGKADSSVKSPGISGSKLLVVRGLGSSGEPEGSLVIAVDAVGAGPGDTVAVAQGGAALKAAGLDKVPCDAAVVAILDHVFLDNKDIISHRRMS